MPSIRKSIRHAPATAEACPDGHHLPRRTVLSMLATAALASRARAQATLPVVRYVDVPAQDWLPFWVAEQNGFDKRYGIELKAVPIVGGTQTANSRLQETAKSAPSPAFSPSSRSSAVSSRTRSRCCVRSALSRLRNTHSRASSLTRRLRLGRISRAKPLRCTASTLFSTWQSRLGLTASTST